MKIVTITQRDETYQVKVERLKPRWSKPEQMVIDSLETVGAEDLDTAMQKARAFLEEPDGD